jgi:hypothetical protein
MKQNLLHIFYFLICIVINYFRPAYAQQQVTDCQLGIQWLNESSVSSQASADAATHDQEGNLYVMGTFNDRVQFQGVELQSKGETDLFLLKVNPLGKLQWAKTFGGNGNEEAGDLKVDERGNIYITFGFQFHLSLNNQQLQSEGGTDIALLKFNPDGELRWSRSAGSIAHDKPKSIVIANDGAIFLAGAFSEIAKFDTLKINSNGGMDAFIARYSDTGALQWVKAGGSFFFNDQVAELALDGLGGLYATGTFQGEIQFSNVRLLSDDGSSAFVMRLQPQTGQVLWVKNWKQSNSQALTLSGAAQGGIYAAGTFTRVIALDGTELVARGEQDAFLAQFDANGQMGWSKSFGGTASTRIVGLAAHPEGVYALANFQGLTHFDTFQFQSVAHQNTVVARLNQKGVVTEALAGNSFKSTHAQAISLSYAGALNMVGAQRARQPANPQPNPDLRQQEHFLIAQYACADNATDLCQNQAKLQLAQIGEKYAQLRWNIIQSDSDSYELQYRRLDSDYWFSETTAASQLTLERLEPSTGYMARIRRLCRDGYSEFGQVLQFETWKPIISCSVPEQFTVRSIQSTQATVQWIPGLEHAGATFEVYYRQADTQVEWLKHITSAPSVVLEDLSPGKLYETQLIATCSNNFKSDSSQLQLFQTMYNQSCAAPGLLYVDFITSNSAQIQWQAVDSSSGYRVRWREVGQANWLSSHTSLNTLSLYALKASTPYEIQVRAKCSENSYSAYTTSAFFKTTIECPRPVMVEVSKISSTTAYISWDHVPLATQYEVYYQLQNAQVGGYARTTVPNVQLAGLVPGAVYTVMVKAKCADRVEAETLQPTRFATLPNLTCNAPETIDITPGIHQANIKWSPVPGASYYAIQYKQNTAEGLWSAQLRTTEPRMLLQNLKDLTLYRVKLTVTCANITSVLDATFETLSQKVDEPKTTSLYDAFNIYPNPTREKFTIDYDISGHKSATLEVYNLFGSKVASYDINNPKGKIDINTHDWDTGVFFCKIVIDKKNYSIKKISISK